MKALYSVAQVSEYFHISKNTLRKWIANGKVDYYKIGNSVRFSEEHVKSMIKDRRSILWWKTKT